VHDAEGALDVHRRQCARTEEAERSARAEDDGQETQEDAADPVAVQDGSQNMQ
jgi:hypothetical protein